MSPIRKSVESTQCSASAPPTLSLARQQLAGEDADARREAVAVLAALPPGPELDRALGDLVARVGVERDRSVLAALATHLSRHDRAEVVDGLLPYLAVDDAVLRNAVVEILATMPEHVGQRLPDLLNHQDSDVRVHLVMLLAALRVPQTQEWLGRLVTLDPEPTVVAAALGELLAAQGNACAPTVHVAAQRFPDDPFIAFMAGQLLAGEGRVS